MLDTQFVAHPGTATFDVRGVDASTAEHFGCPGADVMLVGRLQTVFGNLVATGTVPGRAVRVPGWSKARLGVRAVFVPWGPLDADNEVLEGFLGQDA